MTLRTDASSALKLTRPAQWPILSAQLAVGILLAVPVLRPDGGFGDRLAFSPWILAAAWAAWVPLLNGGTLAFNSAYDRDTGPVAYLRNPPPPPAWLAAFGLAAMIGGALLGGLSVGLGFGLITLVCVLLSVLYSHPAVRLKARPGLDLLTNMIGYGAGTTVAGILAGRAALDSGAPPAGGFGLWFGVGFGLLFGSFYPLTQIYQIRADRGRGDRTLATALGVRRSLVVALLLGLAAGGAFWVGLDVRPTAPRWPLIAALGLWIGHLVLWLNGAAGFTDARHERGMYIALALWAVTDLAILGCWFG